MKMRVVTQKDIDDEMFHCMVAGKHWNKCEVCGHKKEVTVEVDSMEQKLIWGKTDRSIYLRAEETPKFKICEGCTREVLALFGGSDAN